MQFCCEEVKLMSSGLPEPGTPDAASAAAASANGAGLARPCSRSRAWMAEATQV